MAYRVFERVELYLGGDGVDWPTVDTELTATNDCLQLTDRVLITRPELGGKGVGTAGTDDVSRHQRPVQRHRHVRRCA